MAARGRPITIALDAMGGDFAPDAPIEAAARISRETTIQLVLTGDEQRIRAALQRFDYDGTRIEFAHASEVVEMHEKPKVALGKKPDASVAVGARLVGSGSADGLVSAGSTGALILSAAEHIPRVPGIKRAALAAVYPTHERGLSNDRFSLMLDVGATVRCGPEELLHFAYMGHAYASRISKVPYPSIGLLNVGDEETKGDAILTEAHRLLSQDPRLNFIGNVEGTDIPRGIADVIVCEGLLGNVALKMAEGMGEVFSSLGAWAYKRSLTWKAGFWLLSSGLRQLKNITDYREYGGAPLLGFRKIVIKAHGRSHARAIANSIKVAAKAVRDGVCEEIENAVVDFDQARGDQ
ncbi:MAG: phosphate acyltransferase PlsX [Myxococcota bacterium]